MYSKLKDYLTEELQSIEDAGLYKNERVIISSQDAVIKISTGQEVINFCANNYLGLSNNPEVIQAAKDQFPCDCPTAAPPEPLRPRTPEGVYSERVPAGRFQKILFQRNPRPPVSQELNGPRRR